MNSLEFKLFALKRRTWRYAFINSIKNEVHVETDEPIVTVKQKEEVVIVHSTDKVMLEEYARIALELITYKPIIAFDSNNYINYSTVGLKAPEAKYLALNSQYTLVGKNTNMLLALVPAHINGNEQLQIQANMNSFLKVLERVYLRTSFEDMLIKMTGALGKAKHTRLGDLYPFDLSEIYVMYEKISGKDTTIGNLKYLIID